MKNQGRIDGDLRTSPLLCGSWIAVIGPNGPSEFKYRCGSWNCVKGFCNYELKVEYTQRIVEDFGPPLVHVFMARRPEKEEMLSSWIKRKVVGDYWRVSSDADTVIMSNRTFPGARRIHILVLPTFVHEEFGKTWSGRVRVAHSRAFAKLAVVNNTKPLSYGLIHPDYAGPFYQLKSEIDQAHWLFHNCHRFIRKFKTCDVLLEKYRDFWPEWRRERQQAQIEAEQPEEIDILATGDSGHSFMVVAKPVHWEQKYCDVGLIERLCILSIDTGITGAELSRVLAAAR